MRLRVKGGIILASAGLFVTLSGPAMAQKTNDARFARDAAMGSMLEVELGKLAVQRASSDKVKQFGQRMVDDHSKGADDLKAIAVKDNLSIPGELDASHKAMVDRYSRLSGTAFDRAYMRDMVKDHQTDIADFRHEADSGLNADLKSWATTTLPTLQEHLRIAKETEGSLGVTSTR